jgi:hypothetical protein
MGLQLKVECANWSTTVSVNEEVFEKRASAVIEAMTLAIEKFVRGEHETFDVKDGQEELALEGIISCEGNICKTEHILINAGRYDLARFVKNNLEK